jgi:hypothetical protein
VHSGRSLGLYIKTRRCRSACITYEGVALLMNFNQRGKSEKE